MGVKVRKTTGGGPSGIATGLLGRSCMYIKKTKTAMRIRLIGDAIDILLSGQFRPFRQLGIR